MVTSARRFLVIAFAALVACESDHPVAPSGPPAPTLFGLAEQTMRMIPTNQAYLNIVHAVGGDGCGVTNAGNSITGLPISQGVSVGSLRVVDVAIDGCLTAINGGVEAEIIGVLPGHQIVAWSGGGSTAQQEIHVVGGTPNFDHLDYMKFVGQFNIRAASSTCAGAVDRDPPPIEDIDVELTADGKLAWVFADGGRMVMSQTQNFVSAQSEAPVEVSPGRYAEEMWTGMVDWSDDHDPSGNVKAVVNGTWSANFMNGIGGPVDCYVGGPLGITTFDYEF